MPERVPLKRTKGFRLQEVSKALNGQPAVKVARPGMWGNHAAIRDGTPTGEAAVASFRRWVENEASWAWKARAGIDLRGKNLACFCAIGSPCHADVLLELANAPTAKGEDNGTA